MAPELAVCACPPAAGPRRSRGPLRGEGGGGPPPPPPPPPAPQSPLGVGAAAAAGPGAGDFRVPRRGVKATAWPCNCLRCWGAGVGPSERRQRGRLRSVGGARCRARAGPRAARLARPLATPRRGPDAPGPGRAPPFRRPSAPPWVPRPPPGRRRPPAARPARGCGSALRWPLGPGDNHYGAAPWNALCPLTAADPHSARFLKPARSPAEPGPPWPCVALRGPAWPSVALRGPAWWVFALGSPPCSAGGLHAAPGPFPPCSSPGLSRGASPPRLCGHRVCRGTWASQPLAAHLFAPRLPGSRGTTGENPKKRHAGAGPVPSAQVPPGKDFIPVLVKRTGNSTLEPRLRVCFLGPLLVAITVSVRVPARNRWHAHRDDRRNFNKRTSYKEEELSEGARLGEGGRSEQGKRLPQQKA
ncbi:basic proline-rich protein-like [Mirounga angustirostris]|uniref:basic proline-rich protein-like n=1 Tax=Mirounga angustirostris TaxID=9716 RepID=UPI00313BA255